MATVFFDKQHTKLVNLFCEEKDPITLRPIFSTNLNFMVFAATVGRSISDSCKGISIDRGPKEIKDSTFKSIGKDSIVYLLALDGERDGEILRNGNENEVYKYIENYAFIGCQEIEKWLADRFDDKPYEVLLDKIMESAENLINTSNNNNTLDIDI